MVEEVRIGCGTDGKRANKCTCGRRRGGEARVMCTRAKKQTHFLQMYRISTLS